MFKSHNTTRKGASKLRNLDFAERHGFIKGVIKEIVHDPGRGAPLAKVQFRNSYKFKVDKETFVAAEGLYSGQFIYCGKKGAFACRMRTWGGAAGQALVSSPRFLCGMICLTSRVSGALVLGYYAFRFCDVICSLPEPVPLLRIPPLCSRARRRQRAARVRDARGHHRVQCGEHHRRQGQDRALLW